MVSSKRGKEFCIGLVNMINESAILGTTLRLWTNLWSPYSRSRKSEWLLLYLIICFNFYILSRARYYWMYYRSLFGMIIRGVSHIDLIGERDRWRTKRMIIHLLIFEAPIRTDSIGEIISCTSCSSQPCT